MVTRAESSTSQGFPRTRRRGVKPEAWMPNMLPRPGADGWQHETQENVRAAWPSPCLGGPGATAHTTLRTRAFPLETAHHARDEGSAAGGPPPPPAGTVPEPSPWCVPGGATARAAGSRAGSAPLSPHDCGQRGGSATGLPRLPFTFKTCGETSVTQSLPRDPLPSVVALGTFTWLCHRHCRPPTSRTPPSQSGPSHPPRPSALR